MAKAQQPQPDHAEGYKLVNEQRETELEFDTWEDAQDKLNEAVEEFSEFEPDDFRIVPITNSDEDNMSDETDDTPEFEDRDEPDAEPVEVVGDQETEQVHEQNLTRAEQLGEFPEITPIEDTARSIINQLDYADMTRLVWDPNAESDAVPYNPSRLPYNRPEPSAEAFDMFATIIEGAMDVDYSVVDAEFEQADETLGCTVVIEKQTETGSKRLVGVKTRKNKNLDHWRERLYSKARRNALKQDIPPTWLSALLRKYKAMGGER